MTLIVAAIGGLLVVGFLEATDGDLSPASALGGAFTVEMGDNGMPYIAIDPEGLGQNEAEPITASGGVRVARAAPRWLHCSPSPVTFSAETIPLR